MQGWEIFTARTAVWLYFLLGCAQASSPGQWIQGRGTFYGTDAWSIHDVRRRIVMRLVAFASASENNGHYNGRMQGSCGYGTLYPDEPLVSGAVFSTWT